MKPIINFTPSVIQLQVYRKNLKTAIKNVEDVLNHNSIDDLTYLAEHEEYLPYEEIVHCKEVLERVNKSLQKYLN